MRSADARRWGAIVLAAGLLVVAAPASADGKTARQHLEAGLGFAGKGEWEQALVQFEEAHHLDPRPATLFNVAQARQKTGRFRAAIEAYRALLAAKSSLSAHQVTVAQRQLAAAEQRVARLTIEPRSLEPSDEITVDEQVVNRWPVLLDPGSHIARVRRGGEVIGERRVELGEGASITVELAPAEVKAALPPPPPPAPPPPAPTWPAWAVLGTSVAVLAGGTIFAVRGYGAWSDLDGTCGATRTCPESDVDVARRDVVIGDIGIGLGLVGLAVGVYLLATAQDGAPKAAAKIEAETKKTPRSARSF